MRRGKRVTAAEALTQVMNELTATRTARDGLRKDLAARDALIEDLRHRIERYDTQMVAAQQVLKGLVTVLDHQMTSPFKCPNCGSTNVDRDEVDVGVGTVMGPWSCHDCEWSERNTDALLADYEAKKDDDASR